MHLARNHPSSGGICTAYGPVLITNRLAQRATLPCMEDSFASSRWGSSAPYIRFLQSPTRHELRCRPLLGGSERLGLAVLVGFVVQISWGIPGQNSPLLPLGSAGRRWMPVVQHAGQVLLLLKYPERLLPVRLLRARWSRDARNAQYLLGDCRPLPVAFLAYCGIPLKIDGFFGSVRYLMGDAIPHISRTFMMEEKLYCWKRNKEKSKWKGRWVHTALHIVVMAFDTKVLEIG